MTRALILAAGQGRRLHPLTRDKPKCLVELFGKPLLENQVSVLRDCDVTNIQVVTGFCSEQISRLGYDCVQNYKYAESNMVASLFSASKFLDTEEDVVISYGDIIFQRENLLELLASDHQISVMIDTNWKSLWLQRMDNPLDDAESLVVCSSGFLRELGRECDDYSKIQGQYTGLIKVRGDSLRALVAFYESLDRFASYEGADFANMYMTSFLQRLIDAGWRIRPVFVSGGWLEVDTLTDLQSYERLAANGDLDSFFRMTT